MRKPTRGLRPTPVQNLRIGDFIQIDYGAKRPDGIHRYIEATIGYRETIGKHTHWHAPEGGLLFTTGPSVGKLPDIYVLKPAPDLEAVRTLF